MSHQHEGLEGQTLSKRICSGFEAEAGFSGFEFTLGLIFPIRLNGDSNSALALTDVLFLNMPDRGRMHKCQITNQAGMAAQTQGHRVNTSPSVNS